MARIKDSSVEAVKAATDIVALVEGYTRLRKSGARFVGLCPFHTEKTPSFGVSPDRGTFKCFGCGEGGDAISFVEKKESVDFVGAIEFLADRFRVPLEYEETSPAQDRARKHRERLFAVLDRAATFYERYLWESEAGSFARDYLASRGLNEEVCREFRIGLAPGGAALARAASAQGFTREELAGAGLVNRRGNDYFSRRLLFPVADARGRVRGFQARKLYDDDPLQAKFVNSPEGELFKKSELLYGLDHARQVIAKEDRAVIVEGNGDVLALRQAGFEPVVAAMGTALTAEHLRELARLTNRVYLCFDADKAGEDAALRSMDLAVAQGFDVRVVALPEGHDPQDAGDRFAEYLDAAESYLVYRVRLEHKREPDRKRATERVIAVLPETDSVDRQDAVRVASDLLRVPSHIFAVRGRAQAGAAPPSLKVLDAEVQRERDALAGVAAHPALRSGLAELAPEHFDLEVHRRVREHLLADNGSRPRELVELLAELDARAEQAAISEVTGKELLLRLHERALQRELTGADDPAQIKDLQQQLARIREAIAALS